MKAKDLVVLLEISRGYVSDILNGKKGLSKDVIRKLAARFKVSQEAFNRPYKLTGTENSHLRNASVMNRAKRMGGKRSEPTPNKSVILDVTVRLELLLSNIKKDPSKYELAFRLIKIQKKSFQYIRTFAWDQFA